MPADPVEGRPAPRRWHLWQEFVLLAVISVLLAILVKQFLVQAFYIPSGSMEPQFVRNDRILVEKRSYWRDRPQRGDIVVFRDPGSWLDTQPSPGPLTRVLQVVGLSPSGGHLVKRVIGVGGDHVVCCDAQQRLTVNGAPLHEPYLPEGMRPSEITFDVTVPAGTLWVMGDNRSGSEDSRAHLDEDAHGFVGEDLVVGRVWALVWPLGRAEIMDRPTTSDDVPAAPTT